MFNHAYYRVGIPKWVKNRQHRKIGLRAVQAYFRFLKNSRRLDQRQFRYLLDAMQCPARSVWRCASEFLKRLAGQHPEVTAAMEEIANRGKAHERVQLVMSLWQPDARRYFTRPVLLKFFTLFLNDTNPQVRLFGAQGAEYLCLPELLPRLRSMARNDPDSRARQSARLHLPRLKKCFYTCWYETTLGCYLYVLQTPEGEKWFAVHPAELAEHMNRDLTAAKILKSHKSRSTIVWDYRRRMPDRPLPVGRKRRPGVSSHRRSSKNRGPSLG